MGIKAAYHRMALELHPDRGGNEEKFKELQEARDYLANACSTGDARSGNTEKKASDRAGSAKQRDPNKDGIDASDDPTSAIDATPKSRRELRQQRSDMHNAATNLWARVAKEHKELLQGETG